MGTGTRRRNIDVVVTGRQVVTDGGSGAIDCTADDECTATLLDDSVSPVGESGRIRLDRSLGLVLEIEGAPVAKLNRGLVADRIRMCIGRGFTYDGVLISHEAVRVGNAR